MTDDAALLRLYLEQRSDAAFASLVRRHVDLVYSSALRQTGGQHHLAQEVTQMVFTDLARKAASLADHPVLPAWLHRSSRLATLALRRRESRRKGYEAAAGSDPAFVGADGGETDWREIGPVLDEAIDSLAGGDREAILLRFFGGQAFGDIGRELKLSENAARMRVDRALEKLRLRLGRHGITSTASALGLALAAQSVSAAPAGVAVSVASAAVSSGAAATAGWLALMTLPKLPVALSAALLVAGIAVVSHQEAGASARAAVIDRLASQNAEIAALQHGNQRLAAAVVQAQALENERQSLPRLRQAERESEQAAVPSPPAKERTLDPAAGVFGLSNLDRRPAAQRLIRPRWPVDPRLTAQSAEVMVDFVVGSDGQVYNAVVANSTDKAFENSALEAVSQWVFSPGQVSGQAVNTHMQVPIVYTPERPPLTATTAGTWF